MRDGKITASDEPDEPDGKVTADVINARDDRMFVVGAAEPTPSGLGALATSASNEMISLVWKHAQKISKARMAALSRSFGNFDMVVAAGWLLGDLVRGAPILKRSEAHTIGLKIKYEAGKVEKNVAKIRLEAKRAAYGVTTAARLKLLEDAEQKVQTLLRAALEAELPWPAVAQPAARKRKRKRKREASLDDNDEQLAALDTRQLGRRSGRRSGQRRRWSGRIQKRSRSKK